MIQSIQSIQSIQAAMKATAPIVAIPIEGHAPVCVRQKLLKSALKGVQVTSAELGENRWLIIRGIVQHGRIKTCAKFAPIDRRTAIQEISKWAARESDRRKKEIEKGALSASARKEAKRIAMERDLHMEANRERVAAEQTIRHIRETCVPQAEPAATERERETWSVWISTRKLRGTKGRVAHELGNLRAQICDLSGRYSRGRSNKWLKRKKAIKTSDAAQLIRLVQRIISIRKDYNEACEQLQSPDYEFAVFPQNPRLGNRTTIRPMNHEDRLSLAHRLAEARRTLAEYAEKPEEPKPIPPAPVYPRTVRAVTPMVARPSRWYAGRYVNPAILPPPFDPRRCFTAP